MDFGIPRNRGVNFHGKFRLGISNRNNSGSKNLVCKGYLHNWEFLRIPRNSQKTGNLVHKGYASQKF